MSSQGRTGTRYITPIDSTGAPLTENGRGRFTLTAGNTFHFVFGADEAPFSSVHLTGLTAAAIITSATIRDCNHPNSGVNAITDFDTTAGMWPPEGSSSSVVAAEGAGWVATNGVLAVAGGAVGGALWHFAENCAARARLTVVMGATGGDFLCSGHGKR